MNARKPLPIVAALLGLAAIIGAALTLSSSGGGAVEKQVDEFIAQENKEGPVNRLEEPEKKIEQLTNLQDDPGFSKLSIDKQEAVQHRLRELIAFQDFQKRLNAISNPRDSSNQDQLRRILSQLNELKISEDSDWNYTQAGRRHEEWLEDARALNLAVSEVRDKLQSLTEEGNQVIIDKNAPDLPGRARKVLDKAVELKLTEMGRAPLITGSKTLTYNSVRNIAEVDSAYQKWNKVRATLESVSKKQKR